MNSDLMAQIHAKKALKALSLAEACSSDAGTPNGTPLPSKAPQKAVDESAPDLKAFKNQLAGLFGGPSPKAPTPAAAYNRPVQAYSARPPPVADHVKAPSSASASPYRGSASPPSRSLPAAAALPAPQGFSSFSGGWSSASTWRSVTELKGTPRGMSTTTKWRPASDYQA